MRPIGFSSGALAKGDYRRGIELQQACDGITAIELSALREPELEPLVAASGNLPLERFEYVSFHAPSSFRTLSEESTVELLISLPGSWPIVVHPDLHVSEVGTFGEHRRMGFLSRTAFARVARYVPAEVPLILEAIVSEQEMQQELDAARVVCCVIADSR